MYDTNPSHLTDTQLRHTEKCTQRIKRAISVQGSIGFDEYMHLALHDTEAGYYQCKQEIFGSEGDFTTVPETSQHLAFCLAHACAKLIQIDPEQIILEIGAGSGQLACDILQYLSAFNRLPKHYFIYETSRALCVKQKQQLFSTLPEFYKNIVWLNDLSIKHKNAIILANEVIDCMPVHCFEMRSQQFHERRVALSEDGNFVWRLDKPSNRLENALVELTKQLTQPLKDGYQSEINLELEATLCSWSNFCEKCVMFLIDYGYPRHEYYHPQRNMGTLRCYFKHQVSEDVFTHPGLQDITIDVDFSAVAKAAQSLNLDVLSFSSQRNFMLANNLLEWQTCADNEMQRITQIAQLKQLTLGSALSERFQVMVLGKSVDLSTDQFSLRDMRARL